MASGVQYFPQVIPPSTVLGRLAQATGPVEAIPFASLAAAMGGVGVSSILVSTIAGTNTITGTSASPTPALALLANQEVVFIPAATNTGATTFNRDGLGAKNVFQGGAALVGGELIVGVPTFMFYDGTQYNVIGIVTAKTFTGTTSVVTPLIGTITAATVNFQYNGTVQLLFDGNQLIPNSDATYNLGRNVNRWGAVFTPIIDTGTTGSGALKTNNGTTIFQWSNTGTVAVGATPAATGKGITFPSSQSASSDPNTLDDYSEGTWVPSVGGSATYSVQSGTYTKIGRLVFVFGVITINAIGTGSTSVISGLPFALASGNDAILAVQVGGSSSNIVSIVGRANASATTITLLSRTAASAGDSPNAIFTAGTGLEISGCYQTT